MTVAGRNTTEVRLRNRVYVPASRTAGALATPILFHHERQGAGQLSLGETVLHESTACGLCCPVRSLRLLSI